MAKVYSPKPFGTYPSTVYSAPSDTLQIDVYSASDLYLESITNLTTSSFSINGDQVTVDLEAVLRASQYVAGDFNVTVKTLRNYLGSADGHKVLIQDISADRLEVRILPAANPSGSVVDFETYFGTTFFEFNKQEVLAGLALYTSPLDSVTVFDYVQDRVTVTDNPYSIIFKLDTPVPDSVTIGDLVWITQEVADPILDSVKIIPQEDLSLTTKIQGPNFDAYSKTTFTPTTQYKTWETLLNSDVKADIVRTVFSGSFIEGVQLNVDYRKLENFVHFGSATEQLKNFEYKVKLIEYYSDIVSSLSTSLNGLVSGSSSGSFYFVSQSAAYNQKKQALIGTFTGLERYMYFESSSYESSSLGEFLDIGWPKQNSTKPYVLYNSTSSVVQDWMTGVVSSASLFDDNNAHALVKLIPAHIREDENNSSAELFVQMLGQYYDNFYTYINQFNKIYDRNESISEGMAKDLIYYMAKSFGVDFANGTSLDELWSYTLGLNSTGSYDNALSVSASDRSKEVWKRIINNLPYLLKTKGTERSVRALINCFGIPQTILRIREYGGVEPEFDTASQLEYERFYYALNIGDYYSTYGTGLYGSAVYGAGPSLLYTMWPTSSNALELRFKPTTNYTASQTLIQSIQGGASVFQVDLEKGATENIKFSLSGSSGYQVLTVSASLFDGRFNHLVINRTSSANVDTYTLFIKKVKYGKVTETYSGSLSMPATSGSYSASWVGGGTLYVPALNATNHFSGSVQELRFWRNALQERIINNHALTPTNFQGNGNLVFSGTTSSFDDLLYRLALGTDNNKNNVITTSSFYSQQPDQLGKTLTYFENFSGSLNTIWQPLVETNYLEWPDLGSNRSVSNKIRIEDTTSAGNQLYPNRKIQKSVADNAPIDSPRLGIYLSPTNEINQDIAEQFGGISIDDYIGDPKDLYNDYYTNLIDLEDLYFKKWTTGRYQTQNYIRLLSYYDASLFKLIERFAPSRTNLQTGLLIENHLLKRNKVKYISQPTQEELQYSSSIVIPDVYTVGGAIQDGDGEPFRNMPGYVQEGVIDRPYVELGGTYYGEEILAETIEGSFDRPYLEIEAKLNEFNQTQIAEQASDVESLEGIVRTDITSYGRDKIDGSQYRFKSWYATGSSTINFANDGIETNNKGFALIDSIGEDYWNPTQPQLTGSRTSETLIKNTFHEDYPQDLDIFRGQASFTNATSRLVFTGSVSNFQNNLLYNGFGMRFKTSSFFPVDYFEITATGSYFNYTSSVNGFVAPSASGLFYQTSGLSQGQVEQIYIKVPAFAEYNSISGSNARYQISFDFETYEDISISGGDYVGVVITSRDWPTGSDGAWFRTESGYFTDTSTQYIPPDPYFRGDWLFTTITGSFTRAQKSFVVTMPAYGPYLYMHALKFFEGSIFGSLPYSIKNLKVRPLIDSDVQDYHVGPNGSIGLLNQKYNGCKLTSLAYNVDSPDTIDKGPVITILETSPNVLTARPTNRNNLSNT